MIRLIGRREHLIVLVLLAVLAATLAWHGSLEAQQPEREQYGGFLLIPSGDPEGDDLVASNHEPNRDEQFDVVENDLVSARSLVPEFSLPDSLPSASLPAVESYAAAGDLGSAEAGAVYSDGTRTVVLFQFRTKEPYAVVLADVAPVEQWLKTTVNGTPAVARIPSSAAPDTNPRVVRWMRDGIQMVITAHHFPDMQSVMTIAESLNDGTLDIVSGR